MQHSSSIAAACRLVQQLRHSLGAEDSYKGGRFAAHLPDQVLGQKLIEVDETCQADGVLVEERHDAQA